MVQAQVHMLEGKKVWYHCHQSENSMPEEEKKERILRLNFKISILKVGAGVNLPFHQIPSICTILLCY